MNYPENLIRVEFKYVEMRLEELSLRDELWIAEPASAIRTGMLIGTIQRCRELIQAISKLPISEVAQMNITTSARVCAAVGYMPTAVFTLLHLITGDSTAAEVQAVVDAAEYPTLVTALASTLETKFGDLSAADREADIVGSMCSKMRLLARCYPYQIREIVGEAAVDVNQVQNIVTTPQAWPSIDEDMGGELFSASDVQWDALLENFISFN